MQAFTLTLPPSLFSCLSLPTQDLWVVFYTICLSLPSPITPLGGFSLTLSRASSLKVTSWPKMAAVHHLSHLGGSRKGREGQKSALFEGFSSAPMTPLTSFWPETCQMAGYAASFKGAVLLHGWESSSRYLLSMEPPYLVSTAGLSFRPGSGLDF